MAALTSEQRLEARHELIQMLGGLEIIKPDLLDAVNATDDWIESNQASYTSAMNANAATFQAQATAKQKAALFAIVLLKRYEII